MNRTALGLILVVLGIALAVISGIAHTIGLSLTPDASGPDTFGWKQVVGLVVGVALVVGGVATAAGARREAREGGTASSD